MNKQLSLFGDEVLVPIPECSPLALEKYGTPERVAQLTVEAARRWKQQHPKQNVLDCVPPDWRAYIKANI
jgi:hypothetical protein